MLTQAAETPSAREMCRIGAENESSGLQAQHALSNYPDLRAALLARTASGAFQVRTGSRQKTLILS